MFKARQPRPLSFFTHGVYGARPPGESGALQGGGSATLKGQIIARRRLGQSIEPTPLVWRSPLAAPPSPNAASRSPCRPPQPQPAISPSQDQASGLSLRR